MADFPRFVSFVAVALGAFDIIRAAAHTAFAGHVGPEVAGLDFAGPTGRDQLVLLVSVGASNIITAAALIYLGLTSRAGALVLLAVIPFAYAVAGQSLRYWEAGLVGQGVFPGIQNMQVYAAVCVLTVVGALTTRAIGRRSAV